MDAPLRAESDRANRDPRTQPGEPEIRREGNARARRDEVLHRRVVVELEANLGLESSSAAGSLGEGVAGGARRAPDPGLVRQVEQADNALSSHRMGLG